MLFKAKKPLRVKEQKTLYFGQRQIPYTLVSSRLARAVHIKVSVKKGLEVVVPFRYNVDRAERFLISKQDWIIKHFDKMRELKSSQPAFADGSQITLFGQPIKVRILKHLKARNYVSETADEIHVYCTGTVLSAKKAIKTHFRKTAREYLEHKTHELSRIMDVHYGKIAIREQASRWGSCSGKNNLNFNWKLIFFEPEIINYVIMHELAHTVHHNHSEKFYAFLAEFCPNYKLLRKKLRKSVTPF
jgi:predicted metal-dependent hydrolase